MKHAPVRSGPKGTEQQRENGEKENWNTISTAGPGSVGGDDACTGWGIFSTLGYSLSPWNTCFLHGSVSIAVPPGRGLGTVLLPCPTLDMNHSLCLPPFSLAFPTANSREGLNS